MGLARFIMDIRDLDDAGLEPFHRRCAVGTFNACWKLIDLPRRTDQEDREMVRLAEVSYWHWLQVEGRTPENEGIGLWQLARVYALAGEASTAMAYAKAYLGLAREKSLGAFHEGYAQEALARALMAAGEMDQARDALAEARHLLDSIGDARSRKLLEADLLELGNALDP
jgi:hypothetical protein